MREFPLAITQLTNLVTLSLANNQLTTLPPEIGNLINLAQLLVQNNQLTTLPPEIRNTNLIQLPLDGNPLKSPLKEIVTQTATANVSETSRQNARAIRDYYKQQHKKLMRQREELRQQRERIKQQHEEKSQKLQQAKNFEISLRYENAALLYEELGMWKDAGRLRKQLQKSKSVLQNIVANRLDMSSKVHIKDSVVQRSQIGGSGSGTPFSNCPYCGEELNLPKTPVFCPFCREQLQ